ncbi:hypothetical protein DNTS_017561 [Danionella cerebrum]|uniref:Uncharacterized protein n=1 Tax=Danionella cerebrum TaxID=2873325 RepID=A0A553Q9C4_9TELE|nr:hypothetical protein DNTS_017561 [Danionella translucida]
MDWSRLNYWRWILVWPPHQVCSLPTIPCCSHIHVSLVASKGDLSTLWMNQKCLCFL